MWRMQAFPPPFPSPVVTFAGRATRPVQSAKALVHLTVFQSSVRHPETMSRAVRVRTSADARLSARPATLGLEAATEPRHKAKTDDRRQEARRKPRSDRSLAMQDPGRQWFPRNWPYMILCMVGAIGSSAVAA